MTLTNLDMSHRPGERGRAVWSFQSEYRSRALNHQRSPDKCRQKKQLFTFSSVSLTGEPVPVCNLKTNYAASMIIIFRT